MRLSQLLLSTFIVLCLALSSSSGQGLYRILNLEVVEQGKELKYPWIGGMNNVLMSPIFLDSDTIPDLFVFDRKGDKILTFINEGKPDTIDYRYEPRYERMFPEIRAWAIIVDYNGDGISDMYAHVNTGIQVFKGSRNGEDISFTQASPLLKYPTQFGDVNIWVSVDDLPAIVDVNEDGDMDVLAFGLAENTVTYYENQAVENGWSLDTLVYSYETNCWGRFAEGGLTNKIFLGACKNGGAPTSGNQDPGSIRHAGSTVTAFDQDGDLDKEVLLGDISFDNLVYLHNGGDTGFADMISYDSLFPVYGNQAAITVYPSASILDLNNDRQPDMVVSPFVTAGTENYGSILMYLDANSGDSVLFEHQTDSFLVPDQIDHGEGATVDMVDINGDSLLDIIIGNYGYFDNGSYVSGLAYYQHLKDTLGNMSFELITRDLQNFSLLGLNGMHPTFGDIDSDGDMDMVLGEEEGFVHLFFNQGGSGNFANFRLDSPRLASIDVGQFSAPHLYDMDGDRDLDLIVGRKDGKVNYYWNLGDANTPLFNADSVNNFFGEIVAEQNFFNGFAKPYVGPVDSTGVDHILIGNSSGKILVYEIDPDSLKSGSFNQISAFYSSIDEGGKADLAIKDLNMDTVPDFLFANDRGGLSLYSLEMWDTNSIQPPPPDTPNSINDPSLENYYRIYPNPTKDQFTLEMNFPAGDNPVEVQMLDVLGREILQNSLSGTGRYAFPVSGLPSGTYIISIRSEWGISNRRLIVK